MEAISLVEVSSLSMSNLVGVVLVLGVVQLLKVLEAKYANVLSNRGRDIVYTLLAPVLTGLLVFSGIIGVQDVYSALPLLFAPQGLFVFIKKLLNK